MATCDIIFNIKIVNQFMYSPLKIKDCSVRVEFTKMTTLIEYADCSIRVSIFCNDLSIGSGGQFILVLVSANYCQPLRAHPCLIL